MPTASLSEQNRHASAALPAEFVQPPRTFAPMPFWFLNDTLTERELLRQIAEFDERGLGGFVFHPRVGLPRHQGWMSETLLGFYRLAIEEAARRGMQVILYDEGMYPSGSSHGQVVASDPAFACRGLDYQELAPGAEPKLPDGAVLVAVAPRVTGERVAVFDRPLGSVIRGLHFVDHDAPRGPAPFGEPGFRDAPEDLPPAADILNPLAVQRFIELVYERFHREFGAYFGTVIPAIFTDEPSMLGRGSPIPHALPGTTGILEHVNRFLGEDFTPHLPALWFDDEPDAAHHRRRWRWAVRRRLEETYYAPISRWCEAHGVALTGHPSEPDEIGMERYFQIPGQDIVWRYIEPGTDSALKGPQSTQAKCASSAAIHLGRRRNSNELFGAYGHSLTFEQMKWLSDWCLLRGQNLLYPHAFYYSVRGPRIDERPPDVGPHSPWWDRYRAYADYVARLCWLNTDSLPVCRIAVLANSDFCPDEPACVLFERQRDFHYLEESHLWTDARLDAAGLHLAGMSYDLLIVDERVAVLERARPALAELAQQGRLLLWQPARAEPTVAGAVLCRTAEELAAAVDARVAPDVVMEPAQSALRVRHVVKADRHWYLLMNESLTPVSGHLALAIPGRATRIDPQTLEQSPWTGRLELAGGETLVITIHTPANA